MRGRDSALGCVTERKGELQNYLAAAEACAVHQLKLIRDRMHGGLEVFLAQLSCAAPCDFTAAVVGST